jgi:hypothetical protein
MRRPALGAQAVPTLVDAKPVLPATFGADEPLEGGRAADPEPLRLCIVHRKGPTRLELQVEVDGARREGARKNDKRAKKEPLQEETISCSQHGVPSARRANRKR